MSIGNNSLGQLCEQTRDNYPSSLIWSCSYGHGSGSRVPRRRRRPLGSTAREIRAVTTGEVETPAEGPGDLRAACGPCPREAQAAAPSTCGRRGAAKRGSSGRPQVDGAADPFEEKDPPLSVCPCQRECETTGSRLDHNSSQGEAGAVCSKGNPSAAVRHRLGCRCLAGPVVAALDARLVLLWHSGTGPGRDPLQSSRRGFANREWVSRSPARYVDCQSGIPAEIDGGRGHSGEVRRRWLASWQGHPATAPSGGRQLSGLCCLGALNGTAACAKASVRRSRCCAWVCHPHWPAPYAAPTASSR